MKVPNVRGAGGVTINMTPMIDVVFLLIIFFLVSSHLAKQENNLQLDLPVARNGQSNDTDRPTLVINVNADGEWLLGSIPVEFESLVAVLESRNLDSGGRLQVRIRTDANVPYERFQPLLLACARARVPEPIFAVYESNPR